MNCEDDNPIIFLLKYSFSIIPVEITIRNTLEKCERKGIEKVFLFYFNKSVIPIAIQFKLENPNKRRKEVVI